MLIWYFFLLKMSENKMGLTLSALNERQIVLPISLAFSFNKMQKSSQKKVENKK